MSIAGLFARPGEDIRVRDLFKQYRTGDQKYTALAGVSCDITKGTVLVLHGPSGCGKSTFLNMLGGIDRPDRGEVSIGGWLSSGTDITLLPGP